MILEKINQPNDIKNLKPEEYGPLADEIRQFILEKISKTGGHLASNLGVVELTMAMHLVFDLPEDKIIWDVGHQSYTHKILTGRKEGFDEIRCYGGLSGFPNPKESECDAFNSGHSSTSISVGLGLAQARDLKGDDNYVVSVIGDGALTGGMAYEALNNASSLKSNFIIVLNDNNMSIAENIGGMSRALGNLRTAPKYNELKLNVQNALSAIPKVGNQLVDRISRTKSGIKQLVIPGMVFEDMDLTYLGPVDGYDIPALVDILEDAKRLNRAVVVHVITKKGKGYKYAEKYPEHFHGVGSFDIETGKSPAKKALSWTDVFAKTICSMADKDPDICAITAAMPEGTGLKRFAEEHKDRFFDVGIAEQHGVTFAAGLAAGGMKPYFAVYSSFMQRAFDQAIHDVCIQNQNVTLCIDRAGIVGNDGETHQGLFDLSFLSMIPNMTVMAPKNCYELADMLRYSAEYFGPMAIRYPRGNACSKMREFRPPIEYGKAEMMFEEKDIALLAVGTMVEPAYEVRERLKAEGYSVSLVNARFVSPVDEEMIARLAKNHRLLVTLEENVYRGGFGERVAAISADQHCDWQILPVAIPNQYLEHGNVGILKHVIGLDADGIYEKIKKLLKDNSYEKTSGYPCS